MASLSSDSVSVEADLLIDSVHKPMAVIVGTLQRAANSAGCTLVAVLYQERSLPVPTVST